MDPDTSSPVEAQEDLPVTPPQKPNSENSPTNTSSGVKNLSLATTTSIDLEEDVHVDPVGSPKMPENTAFYFDSALFLENAVANPAMKFTIDTTEFLESSYWAYEVKLTTSLDLYKSQLEKLNNADVTIKEDCVIITKYFRYSKLEWLRGALAKEYPAIIIPPVPPKDISYAADTKFAVLVGEETDPPMLVLQRKREFCYFLNYVGGHIGLQQSILLRDFLFCENSDFQAFKDSTATLQSQTSNIYNETKRHVTYQTKSALGWLKSKVTSTKVQPQVAQPYANVMSYAVSSLQSVDELRVKAENHYILMSDRTAETLYFSSTLSDFTTASDWIPRTLIPDKCEIGTRIQTKQGLFGVVRWFGRLPTMPLPEVYVGVQWDCGNVGNNDGVLNGTRYFQTKSKTGGSFVPISYLYHPLPSDSVVDALDAASYALEQSIRLLSLDQERRMFHFMSDLQLLKGWFESTKICLAHFHSSAITLSSMRDELHQLRSSKRESVTYELDLEVKIEKLSSLTSMEKKTFESELIKLRNTIGTLWRSIGMNFIHYNQGKESKPDLEKALRSAAKTILDWGQDE